LRFFDGSIKAIIEERHRASPDWKTDERRFRELSGGFGKKGTVLQNQSNPEKNLSNRGQYDTITSINRSIPEFIFTQVQCIQCGYLSTGAVRVFFADFAMLFCFNLSAVEMEILFRKNTD